MPDVFIQSCFVSCRSVIRFTNAILVLLTQLQIRASIYQCLLFPFLFLQQCLASRAKHVVLLLRCRWTSAAGPFCYSLWRWRWVCNFIGTNYYIRFNLACYLIACYMNHYLKCSCRLKFHVSHLLRIISFADLTEEAT